MSSRRRILFLTQWFDPEPTPKGLSFSTALAENGFDIEVLTGFPNYPEGRIYNGYKLIPHQIERHGNVVVHRSWLYPSHDRSSIKRAANYLSFLVSALLCGLTKITPPDLIYAYHPPATVGAVGALLARYFNVPLILDVQDLWPDTVLSSGMMGNGLAMRTLDSACRWEYKQADIVVTPSRQIADILASRGVEHTRLRVVYNWADEARINTPSDSANADLARDVLGNSFSILFAGQMGEAQGLENVVHAAAMTPQIKWVFLGNGTARPRLESTVQEQRLENVKFVDRVPMSAVNAWLKAAGALLVHLSPDPLYFASIPSKTQAYMLAGRPILMVANGAAAELVDNARAGVVCQPGNTRELANAAERLASMSELDRERLGENGRNYYQSSLSFDVGVDSLVRVFRETLAS